MTHKEEITFSFIQALIQSYGIHLDIEYEPIPYENALKTSVSAKTDGTLLLEWIVIIEALKKMLSSKADKYIIHSVTMVDEDINNQLEKPWQHSRLEVEITYSEVRKR